MIKKWAIKTYKALDDKELGLAPISVIKEGKFGFLDSIFQTFSLLLRSARRTKDISVYNDNDIINQPMELSFTIIPEKDEQIDVKLVSKHYNNSLMFISSFRIDYKTKDGKEYYIQNNPAEFSKEFSDEITSNSIFSEYKKYADIDFNSPKIVRDEVHFLPCGIYYPYKYKKNVIDDFISLLLQVPELPLKNYGVAKRHVREMMLTVSIEKELVNHLLYLALNTRPNLFKFDYTNYFYDLFQTYIIDDSEDAADREFPYYEIELEDWYFELSKLGKDHRETILKCIRNEFKELFTEMLKERTRFTKPCELPRQIKKAVDFLSTYLKSDCNKAVKLDYLSSSVLAETENQMSHLYQSGMKCLTPSTILEKNEI